MQNLSRTNYYLQCLSDVISILISFVLAFIWRFRWLQNIRGDIPFYRPDDYITLLMAVLLCYMFVAIFILRKDNYIHRTFSDEIRSVSKTTVIVYALIILFLFFTKLSNRYSRVFMFLFFILFWFICLLMRVLITKIILPKWQMGKNSSQFIVVGTHDSIRKELKNIQGSGDWRVQISGLAVVDEDMVGEYIGGVKVIANHEDLLDTIRIDAADGVLLLPRQMESEYRQLARKIYESGKVVYINFNSEEVVPNANFSYAKVGDCDTICYSPLKDIPRSQMYIKRFFDVVISLLLLPLFLVVILLSAILNNIESPGPIFTRRVRVGKNGRRFFQFRFRIFRMDAEQRIKNGKNPMTTWGRFLSFSHLDRLPLIFNVLISDMSLVGPHAPRLSRFLEYGTERRKNLCVRPGILGHWSFEQDEQKIIHAERAYIEKWSLGKDCSIIVEFIFRYITGQLKRHYDPMQAEEELQILNGSIAASKPLEYDHSAYTARNTAGMKLYHFFKRLLDIVLSLLAIVILSPLLLVLMILVMLDDLGSPFYAHDRIGMHGKRIHIYKFRSMRMDAGELKKLLTPEQLKQYETEFKIDDDPRITKIGGFLRRSSLDELPQLFNILKGDLSIVGPRPIVEQETKIYGKDIAKLLSVKPGLTGYWQAYARNNATYESGERQAMEMYYVDHASLSFDVRIVFKTIGSVLKHTGAK